MLITSITPNGRGMSRVLADGQPLLVDDEFIKNMGLSAPCEPDDGLAGALLDRARFCAAVRMALRSLDYRDYSSRELARKLIQKGADRADAELAVDYVASLGYINDAAYAARIAESCIQKGYGEWRVRQELSRRGIARDIADEIMDELPDDAPARLRECFERKYAGADLSDPNERRRVASGLARRGFSWDDINSFLSRACDD